MLSIRQNTGQDARLLGLSAMLTICRHSSVHTFTREIHGVIRKNPRNCGHLMRDSCSHGVVTTSLPGRGEVLWDSELISLLYFI